LAGRFRAGIARRNSSRRVHALALEPGPPPAAPLAAGIAWAADGEGLQELSICFGSSSQLFVVCPREASEQLFSFSYFGHNTTRIPKHEGYCLLGSGTRRSFASLCHWMWIRRTRHRSLLGRGGARGRLHGH